MKTPTFDADGYPSDETLEEIRSWPINGGVRYWLDFCSHAWNSRYGAVRYQGHKLELVTGGWSGNESVLSAMEINPLWVITWLSSHRGGLHRFTTEHASF